MRFPWQCEEGYPLSNQEIGDIIGALGNEGYFKKEGQPTETYMNLKLAKCYKDVEKIMKKLGVKDIP